MPLYRISINLPQLQVSDDNYSNVYSLPYLTNNIDHSKMLP